MTNFRKLITMDVLRELVENEDRFDHGLALADSGAVKDLTVDEDGITATVVGEQKYLVELFSEDDEALSGNCTCDAGEQGDFCEHQTATGVAFLNFLKKKRTRNGVSEDEEDEEEEEEDEDTEGLTGLADLEQDWDETLESDELLEQEDFVHAVAGPPETSTSTAFNWKAFLRQQSRQQLISMLELVAEQYPGIVEAYSQAQNRKKP